MQRTEVPHEGCSFDAELSLQALHDHPACPGLVRRSLGGVLSWQVRNETTVRRALAAPRIAPEWLAALLALGATVTTNGTGGTAETALEAFLRRRPEGRVAALSIPAATLGLRWGEARVARTPADGPIVAAFAAVDLVEGIVRQARLALTGVWPGPVRLVQQAERLVGGRLDEPSISMVAAGVVKEVAPKGDFLGSAEYRRAMAGVLARRALLQCLRQEAGE